MVLKLHKLLALVVISAFLLVGYGEQVHALVLCFGADGHSAIEKERDGHCTEGLSEARPHTGTKQSEKVLLQGRDLDSCLDFCLSLAGDSIRKTQISILSVPSLPPVSFRGFRAAETLTPNLSLFDIPPPNRAALALRTTVLLI